MRYLFIFILFLSGLFVSGQAVMTRRLHGFIWDIATDTQVLGYNIYLESVQGTNYISVVNMTLTGRNNNYIWNDQWFPINITNGLYRVVLYAYGIDYSSLPQTLSFIMTNDIPSPTNIRIIKR